MLVIPILLFAGISLKFNQANSNSELSSSFSSKQIKTTMVSAGQQSLVKFLLKK